MTQNVKKMHGNLDMIDWGTNVKNVEINLLSRQNIA